MAVYHTNLRVVTRSKGESAVAAAAYRAGIALRDERQGVTQDYSRKKGVAFVSTLTPPGAPAWASETAVLWNAAEAAETRVNARVARELIVGLPHELAEPARQQLAQALAAVLVDRYGVAVLLAVHAPDRGGDQRNHHAHLLMTTRALGPSGFGPKVRVLDDRTTGPQEVEWLRAKVAELTNAALAWAGLLERVDHRSLVDQAAEAEKVGDFERAARLTREPTRHLGRAATSALRRGHREETAQANATLRATHRRALAAYLIETRAGRRRIRKAAQAKLTARQSAALGKAAGAAAGTGSSARQKGTSAYEQGLLDVVRQGRQMASAVIQAAGERERLADRLAHLHGPEARALRERWEEAQSALGRAQAEAAERRARLRQALQNRSAVQQAWDTGLGPRPKAWRPAKRHAWEAERRQLWGKLRRAIREEQEAQQKLGPVARAALRSRVAEARRKLAEAEAEIRREPDRDALPQPHQAPRPSTESRPRPRLH